MAEGAALGIPTFMAIIENRSYFDTLDDEVGQAVRKIDPRAKQSIYRESKADLFELVSRRKGVVLQFRKKRMSLEEVNDSVLIKIGPAKRGHLSAYRGEWVRVIWSSTYGFSMNCLVHKLKVTPEMEKKLMLRGPYTNEEFTDEVAKAYPFRDVTVDGLSLVRSAKGIWISPIPTYRALKNLEMDEIRMALGTSINLQKRRASTQTLRWWNTSNTQDSGSSRMPPGRISIRESWIGFPSASGST